MKRYGKIIDNSHGGSIKLQLQLYFMVHDSVGVQNTSSVNDLTKMSINNYYVLYYGDFLFRQ